MKQGHQIPMRGGYEHDALTGWRRFLNWRTGERKRAKRSYAKRVRSLFRKFTGNNTDT
jgi:hypothetical protein